ncbi:MAG TPA: DUF6655 family protein [Gemmata sp.]|jgi:hypothetical protein|nr:DUF6655 family protein [Gemmata sp.]
MFKPQTSRLYAGIALAACLAGCGTLRTTDTTRSATEMLLVSQSADQAVAEIDFTPLAEKTVFLDASGIDKDLIDKGYVMSLVRQYMLANGALLQDDKTRAEYVVDLRIGALGTDRHSMLVGTPAVQLPSVLPGLPTNIPEIALVKKNHQRGVAKVAVFAYNRITGRALWQSGTAEAVSREHDTWFMGAGPFSHGTIRQDVELGGEPLPKLPDITKAGHQQQPTLPGEQLFLNSQVPAPPPPIPAGVLAVTGAPILSTKPVVR